MSKKEIAEQKLIKISERLQEDIKKNDKIINELRPIAIELGYNINPNTGEVFKTDVC